MRAKVQESVSQASENEENFKKLLDSHDHLNLSYKKILSDHEQLQKLYLQLETEYDELYKDLNKKHSLVNGLSGDLDDLRDKYVSAVDKLEATEKQLEKYTLKCFTDACVNTVETGSKTSVRTAVRAQVAAAQRGNLAAERQGKLFQLQLV